LKLLVMDIEGTLFEPGVQLPGTSLRSTIWQAIATTLGPEAVADEVRTHSKWESGDYSSYLEWMRATIEIHKKYGLTRSAFEALVAGVSYNPGLQSFMQTLDRDRYEVVLISGGFRELAARAQADFSIHHAFAACEYLFDPDGTLASFNLLPCDFRGKVDFIGLMLAEYGLTQSDWVFIGDGANDVPIASAAPLSIGFRPDPRLAAATDYSIDDFAELVDILKERE